MLIRSAAKLLPSAMTSLRDTSKTTKDFGDNWVYIPNWK